MHRSNISVIRYSSVSENRHDDCVHNIHVCGIDYSIHIGVAIAVEDWVGQWLSTCLPHPLNE